MSKDRENVWAGMSGTLAGAVDCAIVNLQCNNPRRALELLLEAQAQWDKHLEELFQHQEELLSPRVIPSMVQE